MGLAGVSPAKERNDRRDARRPHRLEACATLLRMKHFWLVKQEPGAYSWSDFVAEGKTAWTGVRNYTARNNLRKMQKGDEVFFYHSGEGKEVVGIAKVVREAYPDSTAKEGDWSAVDLAPIKPLRRPVTLAEIKSKPALKNMPLIRQSRLSVIPVTAAEFETILKMSGTARGR